MTVLAGGFSWIGLLAKALGLTDGDITATGPVHTRHMGGILTVKHIAHTARQRQVVAHLEFTVQIHQPVVTALGLSVGRRDIILLIIEDTLGG